MYLGSWKIDDLLTFTVNTHDPDTTGNPAKDADSVPTYRVYEDETGTPLLTGSMAKLDDANTTGFYSEQITLSAANGFEKGKCYNIRIEATVDTIVGVTTRNFQIEAEVDSNTVSPSVTVGTNNDKTGYAIGVGGIASTAFAAGAIDSAAIAANAVDEIFDEQIGDSTVTFRQALKLMVAALGGKASGAATTTMTFRNVADTTDVIVATVDADGNRTAVTLSL
jgi:hypothetical protein